MKTTRTCHGWLALLGLGVLLAYVLACTSFSPDDSKVLYPAFDRETGMMGIWAYDRKSKQSEPVFVPCLRSLQDVEAKPVVVRPLWLPDGRNIVVAWPGPDNGKDHRLNLALIPQGGPGPVRFFALSDLPDAEGFLSGPLPVSGSYFLAKVGSNVLARIDLATGQVVHHQCGREIGLIGSADGQRVFYSAKIENPEGEVELGALDARTFAQTPMFKLQEEDPDGEGEAFAISQAGDAIALTRSKGEERSLVVLQKGKPKLRRVLPPQGSQVQLGNAQFSPRGDVVYAAYRSEDTNQTTTAYGFLEIPLDERPIRRVALIDRAPKGEESDAMLFQLCLSHDGKTLAVASTYLAVDEKDFPASDCALFLVDLAGADRTVTKIPVPLPSARPAAGLLK